MTIKAPVQPNYGSGVINVLGAAGTTTITLLNKTRQVILTNQGANPAYARVGPAGIAAATTADYAIPPNSQVVITKASEDNTVNLLSPAGTTMHVMAGEGW